MVTFFSSFLSFLAHIYFLAPNDPLGFLLFCALISLPCLGDINTPDRDWEDARAFFKSGSTICFFLSNFSQWPWLDSYEAPASYVLPN